MDSSSQDSAEGGLSEVDLNQFRQQPKPSKRGKGSKGNPKDRPATLAETPASSSTSSEPGSSYRKRRRVSLQLNSMLGDLTLATGMGTTPLAGRWSNVLSFTPHKDEPDDDTWTNLPADVLQVIGTHFPAAASRAFRLVSRHWAAHLPLGAPTATLDLHPGADATHHKLCLATALHPALTALHLLHPPACTPATLDAALSHLPALSNLASLTLSNSFFPPSAPRPDTRAHGLRWLRQPALDAIARCTALTSLTLDHYTPDPGVSFAPLAPLPLRHLAIHPPPAPLAPPALAPPTTALTPSPLESIAALTALTSLTLPLAPTAPPTLAPLAPLTALRALALHGLHLRPSLVHLPSTTPEFATLAAHPHLTTLHLHLVALADLDFLAEFQALPQITNVSLCLSFAPHAPVSLPMLYSACHVHLGGRLQALACPHHWTLPAASHLDGLPALTALTHLDLMACPLAKIELRSLRLPLLRRLKIEEAPLVNEPQAPQGALTITKEFLHVLGDASPALDHLTLHLTHPPRQDAINALHALAALTHLTLATPPHLLLSIAARATLPIAQLPTGLAHLTASNCVLQPQWHPGRHLLAGPHHLTALHLAHCHVCDATFAYLHARMPTARSLALTNVSGLSDPTLASIATLTTLTALTLNDSRGVMHATTALVPALGTLTALRDLSLRTLDMAAGGCGGDDPADDLVLEDWCELAAATGLRSMRLGVRPKQLDELREVLAEGMPRCVFALLPTLAAEQERDEQQHTDTVEAIVGH